MARFGWAYVDCTDGVNIDGVTGSVMFLTGNNSISGSNYLMYNYNGSVPGMGASAQSSLILTGTLYVSGAISASHFHYEDITRIDASGSTRFGNTVDDMHIRTGSLKIVWPTGVGAHQRTPLLHVDLNTSSINKYGHACRVSQASAPPTQDELYNMPSSSWGSLYIWS